MNILLSINNIICYYLKTVDTIGNCQRPVFSLGVSQHIHKMTMCEKFELNCGQSCEIHVIMEEKTPLSQKLVCFQMHGFGTSKSNYEVSKSESNILVENYFSLDNYTTSVSTALHCLLQSKFLCQQIF